MSVSIICACKNRLNALKISLSSWLLFDEVKEIIIVDWSSDQPIHHLASLSSRIKVIRVNNEEYFNQSQPLNLAARFATQENILKLDCDHILNPYYNFFNIHSFGRKGIFYTGINDKVDDPCVHPLWGILYVRKEDFINVNGFNEKMGKYYAVEDDELVMRLRTFGLEALPIHLKVLSAIHIPHPDRVRVENFEGYEESSEKFDENAFEIYQETTGKEHPQGMLGLLDPSVQLVKYSHLAREHKEKNMHEFGVKNFINNPNVKRHIDDRKGYYRYKLFDWKTKEVLPGVFLAKKKELYKPEELEELNNKIELEVDVAFEKEKLHELQNLEEETFSELERLMEEIQCDDEEEVQDNSEEVENVEEELHDVEQILKKIEPTNI
jgi:glycosyltransferase involved in cell wall biosynthesis